MFSPLLSYLLLSLSFPFLSFGIFYFSCFFNFVRVFPCSHFHLPFLFIFITLLSTHIRLISSPLCMSFHLSFPFRLPSLPPPLLCPRLLYSPILFSLLVFCTLQSSFQFSPFISSSLTCSYFLFFRRGLFSFRLLLCIFFPFLSCFPFLFLKSSIRNAKTCKSLNAIGLSISFFLFSLNDVVNDIYEFSLLLHMYFILL